MSYEVPIERGKIREFATATMSDNPEFTDAEPVVPPTFLSIARNFWGTPSAGEFITEVVGFDLPRCQHGEEEFTFFGEPPRAGRSLRAQTRVTDQWSKTNRRGQPLRFARIVTEFHDEQGTLVVLQQSTIIETAGQPPAALA